MIDRIEEATKVGMRLLWRRQPTGSFASARHLKRTVWNWPKN
jgi:hypothetical protein|tara:strand:- start:62 stop:187 length:126 start_codon:yes stop_codon:yes gene_type:complete